MISPPLINLATGAVAAAISSKVNPPAARTATTTSLALSAGNSTYSVPITATVTISSTTGTPTGSVAIEVNGRVVNVVSVATAAAGVSLTPAAGTDKITANYFGSRTFAPSASSAQTETVCAGIDDDHLGVHNR